ncbi:unnamed protein product [Rotaria sp. Silwood2]|nr:unnamed protein product [Rotaria sp. Silwood2]
MFHPFPVLHLWVFFPKHYCLLMFLKNFSSRSCFLPTTFSFFPVVGTSVCTILGAVDNALIGCLVGLFAVRAGSINTNAEDK